MNSPDRPPVRFSRHNVEFETTDTPLDRWANLEERWFDAEYQIEHFRQSIAGKIFHGETFPIFWPNLGPDVYAAFYGCELEYGEVTSWAHHLVQMPEDVAKLKFDPSQNRYFTQIEKMMQLALEDCAGKYMVGYTDLHPGVDCAMSWRGQEQLCMDFYDHPDLINALIEIAQQDFKRIYNHFDAMLKAERQLSVSWMGIPSFGKMHIPSCDFSALISPKLFERYCLPVIAKEVQLMTHNIFHLDGKGVARHVDHILAIPEIQAIQWVQGVGDDLPILQWVPFIKKIQQAGKSVVVDLSTQELEAFIAAMDPEGLYLCLTSENEAEELDILRRVEQW